MKIKHYLSLFLIFLILFGCQNIIAEPETKRPDIPQPPIEKLGPNQKPLSEVMDHQLYTWKLTPEKTIYVVAVKETENPTGTNDATAFFGDIALYIGEDNKGIAHLQAEIPGVQLDLADSFIEQMTISGDNFIGWFEPTGNNQYELALWYIKENQLAEVKFNENEKIKTSEAFLKLINNDFFQTSLAPEQTGTSEHPTRIYHTFKWNSDDKAFAEIANVRYEEEKINTTEILHLLWQTDPKFYFDYGQYLFDSNQIAKLFEGSLISEKFYLGQDMEEAINLNGEPLTTFNADGTEEYRYLDGFSYVFDLTKQALIEIKVRGTAVQNSLAYFEKVFAENDDVHPIETNQNSNGNTQDKTFQFGEYLLIIELNDDDEITTIRLKL